MNGILLGTSAFTAMGWEGSFYPKGMKPAEFLTYYATKFDTVEVDSTFYRTPAISTVNGWANKTPEGFVFALKVPQVVTHEKVLLDCEAEFGHFVDTAAILDDKLGPMLLQFPYFNKMAFKSGKEFLARLKPFLKRLPAGYDFAVEIRNKQWLGAEFFDLLREHKVAYALIDQAWMPRPREIFEKFDPITSHFTYIRWLGDRKGIEKETKVWDKTIVNRTRDLNEWVEIVRKVHQRKIKIFAYANNHYAGHAPATIEKFQKMLKAANLAA
jgi:uncharacterized protein YecE (DUF72 family)